MLVGHVARLGHGRRDLQRVAQDVDVPGGLGFHGQPVHLAPALVGGGQARIVRHVAGAHGRQHVEHLGFHVIVEVELERAAGGIDIGQLVLGAVFDDALVALGPSLLEQRAFGRDVVVGVQDQHLALGLGLLEVMRDLAGALIRPGRAAVRLQRDGQRVHAAVRHGLQLLAQRHGLRAGLPGVQHLVLRAGLVHAGQLVPHEVDAGREHQAVIGQRAAAGQAHLALVGVDGGYPILDDLDAVAPDQVVVGRGDVGHLLAAAQHQVGDGARDKGVVGLDQGHLDLPVRPHADVLGGGGAAVAAADHDHLAAGAAPHGGATGRQAQDRSRRGGLQHLTTIHGDALLHFFCAANQPTMALSCSSV